MNRVVRQGLMACLPYTLFGILPQTARAQQTAPTGAPQTPAATTGQGQPAPATAANPAAPTGTTPAAAQGGVGGSGGQLTASALQRTPAQLKYGLPRNPLAGTTLDEDLTKPLTLERAIGIGLKNQNLIAIAQQAANAAHDRVIQARSSYFPQVTPTLTYTNSLRPGGSRTITVPGGTTGGTTGNTTGTTTVAGSNFSQSDTEILGVSQLIWDTGRREANVGFARRNAFASEYGLGNERQIVILTVAQAYYNLLRTQELLRVDEESVRRAQTTLEAIRAQVEVGNAAKSDTLQSEADLANARVTLFGGQSDVSVNQATLKNAMGIVTSRPLVLADEHLPPPDPNPDKTTVDQYMVGAYIKRLDLKQQQEIVNAEGYNVRIARIDSGLSFNATANEGYQANPNAGEQREFFVSATYPIFDAGSTRAALRATRAQLEQDRRALDQLDQSVRLAVEQSYYVREAARQRATLAQVAVQAGQLNYDAALEKQRNGLVNILDVLNAEVQLVTAQVGEVQAIYDYYTADASLQRSIGNNDPTYRVNIPLSQQK